MATIDSIIQKLQTATATNVNNISIGNDSNFSDTITKILQQDTTQGSSTATDWRPNWIGKFDGSEYISQNEYLNYQKPSVQNFINSTGCTYNDAVSMLYGVLGSNKDFRDWDKIMASSDPINAARAATAAMYSSDTAISNKDAYKVSNMDIVAKSGNFAYTTRNGQARLEILDNANNLIRTVNIDSPAEIYKNARDFGLDVKDLSSLSAQLKAKGINISTNLADIAQGGLGASTDWTVDPLVYQKGRFASEALASDRALAVDIGIKPSSLLNEQIAVGEDPTSNLESDSKNQNKVVGYITPMNLLYTNSNNQKLQSITTQALLNELLSRLS